MHVDALFLRRMRSCILLIKKELPSGCFFVFQRLACARRIKISRAKPYDKIGHLFPESYGMS
jgi:hypothetical protein